MMGVHLNEEVDKPHTFYEKLMKSGNFSKISIF